MIRNKWVCGRRGWMTHLLWYSCYITLVGIARYASCLIVRFHFHQCSQFHPLCSDTVDCGRLTAKHCAAWPPDWLTALRPRAVRSLHSGLLFLRRSSFSSGLAQGATTELNRVAKSVARWLHVGQILVITAVLKSSSHFGRKETTALGMWHLIFPYQNIIARVTFHVWSDLAEKDMISFNQTMFISVPTPGFRKWHNVAFSDQTSGIVLGAYLATLIVWVDDRWEEGDENRKGALVNWGWGGRTDGRSQKRKSDEPAGKTGRTTEKVKYWKVRPG